MVGTVVPDNPAERTYKMVTEARRRPGLRGGDRRQIRPHLPAAEGAAGVMKAFLMYPDRDFDLARTCRRTRRTWARTWNWTCCCGPWPMVISSCSPWPGAAFIRAWPARRRSFTGSTSWPTASPGPPWSATCTRSPRRPSPGRRSSLAGSFHHSPDSILHRAREAMELFVATLRRLRDITDAHAAGFRSEGFTRFFSMSMELDDDYFAEMQAHLGELAFRRGMLISARLGPGSKGVGLRCGGSRSRAGGTASRARKVRLQLRRPAPGRERDQDAGRPGQAWPSTARRTRWRSPLTTSGASSRCSTPSWASTSAA